MLAVATLASFVVAFATLRILLGPLARLALDQPNERSLHDRPVPRTGGVGVLAGVAVALGFGALPLWPPLAAALGVAVVSFIDDRHGLPAIVRLGAHIVAAATLFWYVLSPMPPLEMALLVGALVWMTNLYNFMDGADGLAGGMALIGFGTYALASWASAATPMTAACLALSAASAAFLCHNLYPARAFLGDVGSIPLGFLAGALGVLGWHNELWPLWFPVLVFGPFIADATITLVKRAVRGERFWQAHRSHYYQRMVLMGLGHRGTANVLYALMLVCAACALLGRNQAPYVQAAAFLSGAAILTAAAIWVDLRWARFVRTQGTAA